MVKQTHGGPSFFDKLEKHLYTRLGLKLERGPNGMDPRQDFKDVAPPQVSAQNVIAGLKEMGLTRGDHVVAHISLSSMGHVTGGAQSIVDALLDLVGPTGTVLMPRFVPYVQDQELFDPENPPPSVTAVPEHLRQQGGAIMSVHPSHPVVAIGSQAEAVTAGHLGASPVGIDSPFDRMARLGAKVLLLGVNQRANTMIHVGEAYAQVRYWGAPRPDRPAGLWILNEEGDKVWVPLTEVPGDSYGFVDIEPFLVLRGLVEYGRIGRARVRLMPGQALIEAVVEFLVRDPAGLLCEREECFFCSWARGLLVAD